MKLFSILPILALLVSSCSGYKEQKDALTAHNTVERVKEEWSKVEKPLTITILDRDKEELEAIVSIGVFLTDNPEETVKEFRFDGETFKPVTSISVDSTVIPVVVYPYRPGLHPKDSVLLSTEMGAILIGTYDSTEQSTDNINVKMKLKEITALLRLKIKSDHLNDILEGVEITCEHGIVASQIRPFNGEWIESRASRMVRSVLTNCMLNNGRHHDFHLVPTEESGEIVVGVKVKGEFIRVSTTLPPLRAGSITELRLTLSKGKLNIGSSWVDTKHPFSKDIKNVTDSVKVLNFLEKDGIISDTYTDKSIAVVIETDGKHGRAIALSDVEGGMMFKGTDFSTGLVLPTVDGKVNEGCYNSKVLDSGHGHDNTVAFNSSVRYSERCAFGHRNGALLTAGIISDCELTAIDAFTATAGLGTAYIPSVFELAHLSCFLEKYKDQLPPEFEIPDGFYTTCCESGENTFYSVNPLTFRISAYNSKAYPTTKLRLFYLF